MSLPPDEAAAVPATAPARRARARRIVRVIIAMLGAVVVALALALAFSPTLRWTAAAMVSRSADEAAWRFVPPGRPIVAALDAQAMFGSAAWRELRPDLNALAKRHGIELGLAERNARFIAISTDGRGFAEGAAAGPRLSPLLLPRFDKHWTRTSVSGNAAVTDGSAVIIPQAPGVVAFAFGEGHRDATPALEASLAGPGSTADALLLDGAALRIVAVPDAVLKRRMLLSLPRDAARLAVAIERLDARIVAGEAVTGEVSLTYPSPDAAGVTVTALQQLRQALNTGLIALLLPFLGEDAAIIGKLPPFEATQDGRVVRVTFTATTDQIRALLEELPDAE